MKRNKQLDEDQDVVKKLAMTASDPVTAIVIPVLHCPWSGQRLEDKRYGCPAKRALKTKSNNASQVYPGGSGLVGIRGDTGQWLRAPDDTGQRSSVGGRTDIQVLAITSCI